MVLIIERTWIDCGYWKKEVINFVKEKYNKEYDNYDDLRKDFKIRLRNLHEMSGDLYGDVYLEV